ncbi:hypothetical protein VW29_05125 [Devosia limi DSM 17137]|uniref:Poly(A) polymerase n=1 Tax=Devosia limi DSM 17137 TaxID=1121477 RepID=A0A0F5LUF5_9HYPH|nr:hypothetical protein VW29_05125 [Devosia limi DSM 17137]
MREAEWRGRAETQTILAVLDGAEGRTRAVGGVVRDTIMGRHRDNPDIDLATELTPEEVTERARRAGIAVYPTGIEHGTVTLKLGDTLAEVTTLRHDVETNGRHAVVSFGADWAEDAARRDFTINALYVHANGTLFDPLGGLADCLEGRVRFIGEAAARIAEDGLRVYRFFRFSASHGGEHFDVTGASACAEAVGHLGHLSAERVGAEMLRMLALPKVAATLRAMVRIGLLVIAEETLQALRNYERQVGSPTVAGRLALLLCDQPVQALQSGWRLSNELVKTAIAVRAAAALLSDLQTNEAMYRYRDYLGDGLDVAAVQAGWGEAGKVAMAEQLSIAHDLPAFPVSGHDLLAAGIAAGPLLGQTLARLERDWIDSGFALDRQALLLRLRER